MPLPSQKTIEKIILENYIEYQYFFLKFQSKFLSGLYIKYKNLENGNLVLYYARQTHQNILREKDYDLNFNISFEKFWDNHSRISPKKITFAKVAEDTLFPKETVRRKITQLINQKVLNIKSRNIGWLPNEQYKKSYNLVIRNEIDDVCKLISFICKKINFFISREKIIEETKKNFTFYWFHYLGAQLQYLKLWNKQFNDLELVLIFLQVAHVFAEKAKEKNLTYNFSFNDPSLLRETKSVSISATSIADVTNIPRATCVRKLKILVNLKIIKQDTISKSYFLIPEAISEILISKKITGKAVKLFSEFYFICIKATSGIKT